MSLDRIDLESVLAPFLVTLQDINTSLKKIDKHLEDRLEKEEKAASALVDIANNTEELLDLNVNIQELNDKRKKKRRKIQEKKK